MTHDHRPTPADQRAAVIIAIAELTKDHEAAIEVAQDRCAVCLALTAANYWITVGAMMGGDLTGLVSETARRRMLAAADAALLELAAESSPN